MEQILSSCQMTYGLASICGSWLLSLTFLWAAFMKHWRAGTNSRGQDQHKQIRLIMEELIGVRRCPLVPGSISKSAGGSPCPEPTRRLRADLSSFQTGRSSGNASVALGSWGNRLSRVNFHLIREIFSSHTLRIDFSSKLRSTKQIESPDKNWLLP